MRRLSLVGFFVAALLLTGCRGTTSGQPPVHLNLDMDFQERFDPQEANPFFADNRSMRPPVPGTVARGFLREETDFYLGRTEGGDYVEEIPVSVDRDLLERGRERYEIYCAVCHGQVGYGEGPIMRGNYGYTPAPSFHQDRLREVSDGYLYDVIVNGVRTMPPYGPQVFVADRWAIVGYIRTLQRSQNAGPEDVPENVLAQIESQRPADTAGDTTDAGQDTTGADTTTSP